VPRRFRVLQVSRSSFEGFENGTAEASYYTWVDQHNTVGLGENVPISTANLNDGFAAFKDGQMIMLRIPNPLSFFAKGLDGRIDDPNAGWKGRGLWSTNGDRTPWLKEGLEKLKAARRTHPGPARSAGALSGRAYVWAHALQRRSAPSSWRVARAPRAATQRRRQPA